MTIRVLLADDQELVRSGIAMILACELDMEVVGQVSDGQQAVGACADLAPDVVVMDVRMPVCDGVEATRRIAEHRAVTGSPRPAVLILTTYNVDEAVYTALRAGAAGFLLKDAAPAELVLAVRALAAGEGWLDPAVTRQLIDRFAAGQVPHVADPNALGELTTREREVLVQMAEGLSNADIATRLFVGEGTVKTHVSHILSKLGVSDRTQAVVAAFRSGLVPDHHS